MMDALPTGGVDDRELLDAYSRAVVSVVEHVGPAVVSIAAGTRRPGATAGVVGAGSGVIFTPDGYVLTNRHVVNEATDLAVTLTDGSTLGATLVGSDADNDPLTYFASPLLMGQAYQLDQQLGLTFPGSYYANFQGHSEKWLNGTDAQYLVLPNGELRKADAGTRLDLGTLKAQLEPLVYDDPTFLLA